MEVQEYIKQHGSRRTKPMRSRHKKRRPSAIGVGTIAAIIGMFQGTSLLSNAAPVFVGGMATLFFLVRGCSMVPNHGGPVIVGHSLATSSPVVPRVPQNMPAGIPRPQLRYEPIQPPTEKSVEPPTVEFKSVPDSIDHENTSDVSTYAAPLGEIPEPPSLEEELDAALKPFHDTPPAQFQESSVSPSQYAKFFNSLANNPGPPPGQIGQPTPRGEFSNSLVDPTANLFVNPTTPLYQEALGKRYVGTAQMSGKASHRVTLSIDRIRDSATNVEATLSSPGKGSQRYSGSVEDNPPRLTLNPIIRTEPGDMMPIILPYSSWHIGPSQITLLMSDSGKLLVGDSTGGEHFEFTPNSRGSRRRKK